MEKFGDKKMKNLAGIGKHYYIIEHGTTYTYFDETPIF